MALFGGSGRAAFLGRIAPGGFAGAAPPREGISYSRALEYLLVIVVMLLCIRFFSLIFSDTGPSLDGKDLTDSNPARMLSALSLYLVGLGLLLVTRSGEIPRLLRDNIWLTFILGLALASVAWSADPGTSLRRVLALLLITAFAAYITTRFSNREVLRLAGAALLVNLAVTLAAVVLLPGLALDPLGYKAGTWRGLTQSSTYLGRVMGLSIIVFFTLRQEPGNWRILAWPALAVSAFGMVMADAATAGLAMAAALAAALLLGSGRQGKFSYGVRLLLALAVVLPFLAFLVFDSGAFFELIGRDPSLTNRTVIWDAAIAEGIKRPWLGFGFRAFWLEDISIMVRYLAFGHWAPANIGNGHSSYLDVWLELGFVGIVLLAGLIGSLLLRAQRIFAHPLDRYEIAYAMIFIFLLVYAITEQVILEHTELTWLLTTVALFKTGGLGRRQAPAQL